MATIHYIHIDKAGITTKSPILSFYLTYILFIQYWKHKFPTVQHHHQINSDQLPHLTIDQQSALWYYQQFQVMKVLNGMIIQL